MKNIVKLKLEWNIKSLLYNDFSSFFFFSPLMYNHKTSSQLYYKYLKNLQRLHARYVQSAKATELSLRNTARKTLDKNAMLALSPKPNAFVCWLDLVYICAEETDFLTSLWQAYQVRLGTYFDTVNGHNWVSLTYCDIISYLVITRLIHEERLGVLGH